MANIAIFLPNKEPQYLISVSESNYVKNINVDKRSVEAKDSTILINPDITLVKDVPVKYWKKEGNNIVEMTDVEKKAIEDVEKQKQIDAIDNYKFDGGFLAQILVEEGIITKDKITDRLKIKGGLNGK